MPGVSQEELRELSAAQPAPVHGFPWRVALRSESLLALMGAAFCYIYVYTFFQTWFHTFLVKGRGVSEGGLLLSALPYGIAVCANLAGGAASDALVRRLGVTWGRRSLGIVGLGSASLLTFAAMFTERPLLTIVLLSLVYGAITFQQAGVFGVCLDLGQKHAGAVVGLMNTSAAVRWLRLLGRLRLHRRSVSIVMMRRSCRWRRSCSWARCSGSASTHRPGFTCQREGREASSARMPLAEDSGLR